jgi:predicted GNAT family acetyltransferase
VKEIEEKMMQPSYRPQPVTTESAAINSPLMREDLSVCRLTERDTVEVLDFLTMRVAHGFGLMGFIRSNGIESVHNRGTFYACRNGAGQLEGVALIGHATLIEARSDVAIEYLARIAQECRDSYILLAEQETVHTFWAEYAERGQQIRLQCRELLFEQRLAVAPAEPVAGLRLATLEDLDLVVPVHARLVYEESGINPLDDDAEGFRRRCARRITQGKTWVWIEDGRLIFKADIVTDAPEVIYLEGVDVHPEARGKGYGRRCMQQLTAGLLERTSAVVLLVNEERRGAQMFYQKTGFTQVGYYDTIFLKPATH